MRNEKRAQAWRLIAVFLTLILVDQLTKGVALSLPILVSSNSGISFGLLESFGSKLVFVEFLLFLTLIVIFKKLKPGYFWPRLGFVPLFAGSVSNMIDRIFRGAVVDFIKMPILSFWPLFNLADVAIVAGAGLVIFGEFSWKRQKIQE